MAQSQKTISPQAEERNRHHFHLTAIILEQPFLGKAETLVQQRICDMYMALYQNTLAL
jgi:hypothetical protein